MNFMSLLFLFISIELSAICYNQVNKVKTYLNVSEGDKIDKKNTYDKSGSWYKGNLHTHTENSPCGRYNIEKVIEMYTSL